MRSQGGGQGRGPITGLVIAGAGLIAAIVGGGVVVFVGRRMAEIADRGPPPTEVEVARAEARLLTAADQAAGDAVAFLLRAAHDGDEPAMHEARAYAHESVGDEELARWIRLAREAVATDPEGVDAEVLRSRMDTDDQGRTRATCDVVARAGEQIWRARVVMVLVAHETSAGAVNQWELLSLEAL